MIRWAVLFLGVALLSAGCTKEPPESAAQYCLAHIAPHAASIVIVDRTTQWKDASSQKFEAGLSQFLGGSANLGRVKFAELRDSEASISIPESSSCLLPVQPNDYGAFPPDPSEASGWLSSRCATSSEDGTQWTENCRPLRNTTQLLASTDDSPTTWIASQLKTDVKDTLTTEIVNSLASIIDDGCADARFCSLFLFSDMIDSNIKRFYYAHQDARSLGIRLAEEAQSARTRYRGRLFVTVLGIGRSEVDSAQDSDARLDVWLTSFWLGYFQAIGAQPACVRLHHIDAGPTDFPLDGKC